MINIKNISKSFDGKIILRNVTLDILDNETLVILGPSGQGKTVLIKTLNRLLEPDSGSIFFDNTNIVALNKYQLNEFRKKFAFVFQNSALFDFLTVRENLSLYMTMHTKIRAAEINNKVKQALLFIGLDSFTADKYPEELSGGMKKRVAIARAMLQEPEYIFYDEPTTGLDKTNAEKVSELINMLKKEISATSIVVTHDIKLMKDISDRVALLKDGEFVFVGNKSEISDDTLSYLYNGVNN